jgi:hypothetical protein
MPLPFTLAENMHLVEALAPAADAAGRSGAYVSLKNCAKLFMVVHITQGNAATIALTINQATAVAGTSAKVITNAVRIWANQDTSVSDTLAAQTAAVNFTTSAAVKNKMVVFEIDPAALDLANGFDCVNIATGASNAANITQAMYYQAGLNYGGAAAPSATQD